MTIHNVGINNGAILVLLSSKDFDTKVDGWLAMAQARYCDVDMNSQHRNIWTRNSKARVHVKDKYGLEFQKKAIKGTYGMYRMHLLDNRA
jgi:hypothetical protein